MDFGPNPWGTPRRVRKFSTRCIFLDFYIWLNIHHQTLWFKKNKPLINSAAQSQNGDYLPAVLKLITTPPNSAVSSITILRFGEGAAGIVHIVSRQIITWIEFERAAVFDQSSCIFSLYCQYRTQAIMAFSMFWI